MGSVLGREEWTAKGHKKSFQDERYALHLDCGVFHGCMQLSNSSNFMWIKLSIYKLFLNKAEFKKITRGKMIYYIQ